MRRSAVLQMFVDDQEILLQMKDAEIEWLKERVTDLEKEIERLTNAVEFHRVASNMRNDDIKKLRMEIGCYEDERSDR